MEYYEILKEIRIDKELSQTQVAKKLGTTQQQIYKYENGLQTMTVDRLKQFCILYEISADNILNLPNKKGKGIQTQNRTKYTFLYNATRNKITNRRDEILYLSAACLPMSNYAA